MLLPKYIQFRTYTVIQLVASAALHAFIPYNITLKGFKATYAEPMPPVKVEEPEPQGDNGCRAPLFKKARSRPQTCPSHI